ncbi:MAG: NAD(+)/NADH kinase [Ardenticatenales bacterium]|nr:NAD(+)/NADH kinase [Ardenticatenales bacterium]
MAERVERVGLLYHPRVEAAQVLARALVRVAESCGCDTWVQSAWEPEALSDLAALCDLLVTFGGDGTILRVARASLLPLPDDESTRVTPPLLTVDFGTLGFLTELQPAQAEAGLRRVLEGNFWLEKRHLLRARLIRDGEVVEEQEALNDVVLARGDGPHAIRLTLFIDGAETAHYTADGMIIATPTGSTAYALGAGGLIMGPDVAGLLAIPVAPHLSLARGFVLAPTSQVMLTASTQKSTVVTLDGQTTLTYEAGDQLHVEQSSAVARFVRTGPKNYFYATLQEKFRRA